MIVRDNYAEGIVFREHLSKQKTSFEVEKLQKVFSKDMKGSRIWSLLPSVLNLSKKFGYLKIIFQVLMAMINTGIPCLLFQLPFD